MLRPPARPPTVAGMPPAPTGAGRALPQGFRIRWDNRVRMWADGSVLVGGSPWRVSVLHPTVAHLAARIRRAGVSGVAVVHPVDRRAARALLDRGFVHPVPARQQPADLVESRTAHSTAVVVPTRDRAASVDRLLTALKRPGVLIVDDASADPAALAAVARRHGADILRQSVNTGPAAARNRASASVSSPFIAFLDSDCIAPADWAERLLHHFTDPAVAAVAPRVLPAPQHPSALARYEWHHSSLDMGVHPGLATPGAHPGFLPTAALVVRRSALGEGFDPGLRLGEDVDLCWRLVAAGWLVRYDTSVIVRHEGPGSLRTWLGQRARYGSSAPALARRHPQHLAPAVVSSWNLATLTALAAGNPTAAVAIAGTASVLLGEQLRDLPHGRALAARTALLGLPADAAGIGRLLRREWWPIGALAVATSPRSRAARIITAAIVAPLVWEWLRGPRPLDLPRYLALRVLDDAAYGTGVVAASLRERSSAPLIPRVRTASRPRASVTRRPRLPLPRL